MIAVSPAYRQAIADVDADLQRFVAQQKTTLGRRLTGAPLTILRARR